MGQNNSSSFQTSSQPLFCRPKAVTSPHSPLICPETTRTPRAPTYAIAANKILPGGEVNITHARGLLRPVSQELTSIHPEYAHIFDHTEVKSSQDENDLPKNFHCKKNSPTRFSFQDRASTGGSTHALSDSISNASKVSDVNSVISDKTASPLMDKLNVCQSQKCTKGLTRSHSTNVEPVEPGKLPKHKRQTSLASSSSIHESVILEDPREHLYNVARGSSFSNYQPSSTSLPVKNSFYMDYSLNLTYAQLAEHRRNHRIVELDQKAAKKLEELGTEINASSTLLKSPFDMYNLGGSNNTHSTSTHSSDTSVSKSKKKRAPAPPTQQFTAKNHGSDASEAWMPSYDHQIKNSSPTNSQFSSRSVRTRISSTSKSLKPPAPQPTQKSLSSANVHLSVSCDIHQEQLSFDTPLSSMTLPIPASSKRQDADQPSATQTERCHSASIQQNIAESKSHIDAVGRLHEIMRKQTQVENNISGDTVDETIYSVSLGNYVDSRTRIDDAHNDCENKTAAGLPESPSEKVREHKLNHLEMHQSETKEKFVHQSQVPYQEVHQSEPQEIIERQSQVPYQVMPRSETQHTIVTQSQVLCEEVDQSETKEIDVHQSQVPYQVKHLLEVHQIPTSASKNITDYQQMQITNNLQSWLTHAEFPKKLSSLLQRHIIFAAWKEWANSKASSGDSRTVCHVPGNQNFKANFGTAYKLKDEGESTENGTSQTWTLQSGEDKVKNIYRTDILRVVESVERSDVESKTAEAQTSQNENEGMNADGTTSTWNSANRPPQKEDWPKQDEKSSPTSTNFPKRSSVRSDDMTISSSNTTQRVFSLDWAPEHDLDSDDDIMDEQEKRAEIRISSEGFKPSIIPSKINDLNEAKRHKCEQRNNKRKDRKEARLTQANEKSKFGSIRKFKKSVHQGMRNAFGSISRASGALLSKNKSREFLDNKDVNSGFSDKSPEVVGNSNWSLSSGHSESVSRYVNHSLGSQREMNEVVDFEILNNSSEYIRDLDFAGNVDNIQLLSHKSNENVLIEKEDRTMTREGVSYVRDSGQRSPQPQYRFVRVDQSGPPVGDILHTEVHTDKNHTNRDKFSYETRLKATETHKIEELLKMIIWNKEQQFETEKLRLLDLENNFRRLREIDVHLLLEGNVQGVEPQSPQQATATLPNNEQNNITPNMSPQNIAGTSPSSERIGPTYLSTDQLLVSPGVNNGNTNTIQTGFFNSFTLNRYDPPFEFDQSRILPLFRPVILDQPLYSTDMQYSITQPASYSPQFTGATLIGGLNNRGVIDLTAQRLTYLSDYMRLIGLPPPANPQQWALLLNFLNNSWLQNPLSGIEGQRTRPVGNFSDPLHTFENEKADTRFQPEVKLQATAELSNLQSFQQGKGASLPKVEAHKQISFGMNHPQTPTNERPRDQQLPMTSTSRLEYYVVSSIPMSKIQPSLTSEPAHEMPAQSPPISSLSADHKVPANGRTSFETGTITANRVEIQREETTPTKNMRRSHFLQAKVYGPIGFRPVTFRPDSLR